MARIALDITPSQLTKAQRLVDAGAYESLQQFGEIAFANQLALEDGADPEDLVDQARERRGTKPLKPSGPKASGQKAKRIPPLPPKSPRKPTIDRALATTPRDETTKDTGTKHAAPMVFATAAQRLRLGALPTGQLEPASTTASAPDLRVLSLVNKPFGLKLVTRTILAAADNEWPRVSDVLSSVQELAAAIGAELALEDREAERSRNLLQTGLPTSENADSQERFASQYVARVARSGQITPGAVSHFALATLVDGRIVLTTAGVELGRLRSPILDDIDRPWQRTLSMEEQRYLLGHVRRFVPAEARDTEAVTEAVRAGHDRPESLLEAVRPALPTTWTDVQARGHLAGVVTRLTELDVIARVWTGRHVHYELGPLAPAVLDTGAAAREVA